MSANANNDRMPVAPSGDIKQMTVPWLFQGLRTESKTGTAFFEYIQDQTGQKVVKKVYFKNGDATFAASSLQDDWLGRWLVRTGMITEQQCTASEELVQKTHKKQGAILVELGFLSPQALVDGVKLQVKHIILSLFSLRMGSYRFDEAPLPMADIIPLQMSTGNLILEGVNSLEWQAVRRSLPAPTTIVRPATDPSTLFQDASLSEEQKTVFSFIDGKRSIEEICGLSGIGDFNALKAMYLLLALRMAEIGESKSEREMEFAREVVRETVRTAAANKEKKPEAPASAAEPEIIATRELIEKAFDALQGQDHYQVLGVTVTSTSVDLKKAYFRLAKSYHPDRHFDPTMADLKQKLEALFGRIHNAYTVLSDQVKRAEYDMAAAKKAQAPKAPVSGEFVEKRAEGYQEDYKEKVLRAAEQFTIGMNEFKTGNYWGALEAFTWATRLDPIKAPYFFYHGICLANIPRRKHEAEESLQKAIELDPTKVEYHVELSNLYINNGLKAKAISVLTAALDRVAWVEKIQEAIVAAGEGRITAVLSDKVAGTADAKQTTRLKVSPAKAAEAEATFAKAMKEFKVNNFGLAVDIFAAATRLDPTKATYFYYHGLCLSRIPRRSEEAEVPLRKAFELDPARMEHHSELGNYYLRTGQKAKAIGILNNALMRFPDAQKIKDAIKAAGGAVSGVQEQEDEKKGGIFSKLFKKDK
jgi:Flp pilus assembly protein TadD/DnaJ-domain-containing protein 1